MAFELGREAWEGMAAEAERVFPCEACGIVVGQGNEAATQRFVAMDNIQDRLHALDPDAHPRDARTAFAMDALKLSRVIREAEGRGEVLLAVVHSHPQHPSYFSATDRQSAMFMDQPTYPDAIQLVLSIYDREPRDLKGFRWDGSDWTEHIVQGSFSLPGPPPGAKPLGDV